eukprot:1497052-Prymnesium_polylepis.1
MGWAAQGRQQHAADDALQQAALVVSGVCRPLHERVGQGVRPVQDARDGAERGGGAHVLRRGDVADVSPGRAAGPRRRPGDGRQRPRGDAAVCDEGAVRRQ